MLKDGSGFDRAKVGAIIFNDVNKRRKLNKLMHNKVFMGILKQLYHFKIREKKAIVILDAPLLYESKFLEYFCYPIMVIHTESEDI